jgi:hypothetical protein
MSIYRLISSDSHIVEPPDLSTSRIDPQFQDRAKEEVCNHWYTDNLNASSYGVLVDASRGAMRTEGED